MPDWSDPPEIAKDAGEFFCFFLVPLLTLSHRCFSRLPSSIFSNRAVSLGGCRWYAIGVFQKLLLVMLGLYTWEIIVQLPFDWSIISRKVRFGSLFLSPSYNNDPTYILR